jgi:subtilase family serine protease
MFAACDGSQPPVGARGAMAQTQAIAERADFTTSPQSVSGRQAKAVCPRVVGKPTCLSLLVQKNGVTPLCSPSSNCGFTAPQLENAYNIADKLGSGAGTNVAVIDAGDLAAASSDLATYRSKYGLGTANLTKYNEYGQQSNYPPSCEDYGWCLESDLDIDMVSAACPKCNILLMESKGGLSDFEMAVAEAVTLGATIVSNGWICYGSYDCGDPNFSQYFDTPGIDYLAASGDGYHGIGAPAVLATVIAVGGTQLTRSGRKYSESIWLESGAGCASPKVVGGPGIAKPSWQHDPDCKYRSVADVSSEAGCSPGVAVYISLYGGWTGVCGTSVSSPFTAGVVGLAGNAHKINGGETIWKLTNKQHKRYFHHPTTGSDGNCDDYLCGYGRYQNYYSGPGGWGAPNGINGY